MIDTENDQPRDPSTVRRPTPLSPPQPDALDRRQEGDTHPDEIAALLVGKTIASIEHGQYLSWEMTVDSITFIDGTRIEFGGNADFARIDNVILPGGEYLQPWRGEN